MHGDLSRTIVSLLRNMAPHVYTISLQPVARVNHGWLGMPKNIIYFNYLHIYCAQKKPSAESSEGL